MLGKKLDSLGVSGVIVNLVFLGLEILCLVGLFISGIVLTFTGFPGLFAIFVSVVLGSLTVVTTIYNARVLNGELKFKKIAYILGFVCLSVFGSILLVISKDEIDVESKENHIVETLTKFKSLLDTGAITEEEYTELKKLYLNR